MKSEIFGCEMVGLSDLDFNMRWEKMRQAVKDAMIRLAEIVIDEESVVANPEQMVIRLVRDEVQVDYTSPQTKIVYTLAIAKALWALPGQQMERKTITSWLYGDNNYNSYIIIYDPGEDIDDLFRAFDGIQYAEMMTLQKGVGVVRIVLDLREGVVNVREHYLKGCEDYKRLWKYCLDLFEAGHFQKLEAHLPWAYWMVNRFKEDIPGDETGLVLKALRP